MSPDAGVLGLAATLSVEAVVPSARRPVFGGEPAQFVVVGIEVGSHQAHRHLCPGKEFRACALDVPESRLIVARAALSQVGIHRLVGRLDALRAAAPGFAARLLDLRVGDMGGTRQWPKTKAGDRLFSGGVSHHGGGMERRDEVVPRAGGSHDLLLPVQSVGG